MMTSKSALMMFALFNEIYSVDNSLFEYFKKVFRCKSSQIFDVCCRSWTMSMNMTNFCFWRCLTNQQSSSVAGANLDKQPIINGGVRLYSWVQSSAYVGSGIITYKWRVSCPEVVQKPSAGHCRVCAVDAVAACEHSLQGETPVYSLRVLLRFFDVWEFGKNSKTSAK